MRGPVLGIVALVLLTGCGGDVAAADASAAAVAFLGAGPSRGCGLLAPDTAAAMAKQADGDCAAALADAKLPPASSVRAVDVAGEGAQVRFDDQAVFLARFPEGWRVTAAGCVRDDPDPAAPYDCEVKS